MVTVIDAFVHCSKHIPGMLKMDQEITWGTDDVRAKGGDYFGAELEQPKVATLTIGH